MLQSVFDSVYLFLPAGVANMTPVVLTKVFGAGTPIDRGVSWRGKRLFGDHKTTRGFIGGTIAGFCCFLIQKLIAAPAGGIDYRRAPLLLGVTMSGGALAGDLAKSFAKRRLDIAPGRSWVPFDQIDYVAGAIAGTVPFVRLTATRMLTTVVVFFVLHIVVSAAGYALRLKEELI